MKFAIKRESIQKNTNVLELTATDENKNLCYFSLANALDIHYYYQFCNKLDERDNVQNADVVVDITLLSENLQLMLKKD